LLWPNTQENLKEERFILAHSFRELKSIREAVADWRCGSSTEGLLQKSEALSSNPSAAQKKTYTFQREHMAAQRRSHHGRRETLREKRGAQDKYSSQR
jgi:hypothetical protein